MSEPRICPNCKGRVPADAPAGVCPACALRAGFDVDGNELSPTRTFSPGGAPPLPVAELEKRLPELEEFELLGQGGMGAVYRARHRKLQRAVAVKVLDSALQANPSFAERFEREARTMAKLDHPNVVRVYDVGTRDGMAYLIMEFVDGVNLRQMIEAGGVEPQQALAMVPQICEALQYAHDAGVVHRDIKPENILVDTKGGIKIADFGLAKLASGNGDNARLTGTRQVMGTPHYMAPEQIEHPAEVDHRADIFALGVVFYELLTGELPVGRFPLPSKKVQVDVRLDDVVLRTLEKEPSLRYQQASELRTDVMSVAEDREADFAETIIDKTVAALGKLSDVGVPVYVAGLGLGKDKGKKQKTKEKTTDDETRIEARIEFGGKKPKEAKPPYEYKSKAHVFGIPLVHIASSRDDEGMNVACGVIAIGDVAIGGVAIGAFAIGGISIGGIGAGLVSISGLALGLLFALGGTALAGGFAFGGFSLALLLAKGASTISLYEFQNPESAQWVTLVAWALATLAATVAVVGAGYAWAMASGAREDRSPG